MKQNLLIIAFALASAGTGLAQTGNSDVGIFGSGVELTGAGALATNDGVTTLYALNQGDNNVLLPAGSTATLSTAWTSSSTAETPVFDLGTFTTGDTLTLNGGSLLTYSNSGASSTAGEQDINYQIQDTALGYYSGFTPVSLPENATGATVDGTGNTRFSTESDSVNLLAGLSAGTYTLNIYNSSGYSDPNVAPTTGTFYDSNGGLDYGATFTVVTQSVPEPSSWAMMLGALCFLVYLQSVRRKTQV
jgi:hypothetical protein